jgi:hypothetical protein
MTCFELFKRNTLYMVSLVEGVSVLLESNIPNYQSSDLDTSKDTAK